MRAIADLKMKERLKTVLNKLNRMMVILAILELICFQLIGSNMTTFYHVQYVTTKNQMEIRKDVQTINKRILWAIICEDDAKVAKEQQADLAERFTKIEGYMDTIKKNLDDKETVAGLEQAWEDFTEGSNKMVDLVLQGKADEATNYYSTTFNDVSETLADALDSVGNASDQAASEKYQVSIIIQVAASVVLILVTGGSLIVARRRGNELTDSIVGPLEEINGAAKKIAEGNLHVDIAYTSEDEIGQVAQSLRESMSKIAAYIEDIDTVMGNMADGNFDVTFRNDFIGDFKNIEKSLSHFTERISESMAQIGLVADQVSMGSHQIAQAAQTLAEGATDQAGIVEELSATINDVTQRIGDNAQSAGDISTEVGDVASNIDEENKRMQELVHAMDTISQTSEEIEKIIDTINDIASQTNLLALNASIEAARAGEAGRGFAVVADQVSALASQSAVAAKSSAQYIETSLDAVNTGKSIAYEAAQKLNIIVENTGTITVSVDSIASASNEQSTAMTQINGGIEQIAHVVETNAATSEESSASSEELANQAQTLKKLLTQFKLRQ